jgi:outer membrane scaffolding protein for murein synthesis (MipA/OmpV family)
MKTLFAAALLATALTAVTHADDYTSTGKPSVTLGAGVIYMPDYSGADTYQSLPIPVISASKEITPGNTLYARGLSIGLDHAVSDQLTVGAVTHYRFGRDSSDSSMLSGMPDIDGAIELGPKIRYQIDRQLGVEATALFDVSDAYDGYTARIGADYVMPLGQVTYLTFAGGLNYGSEDFNNTYYGVTASQARPGRPVYSVDSGLTNLDASVGLRHAFTNHWSVQGKLGADYLVADVADSPLVEQELQPSLMLGLSYTF